MHAKFLVVGTIVGGLVIFLWGAVTHAILPQPLSAFKDEPALVEAVRAHTNGNGVYFATRGMLAAVSFRSDLADKTQSIAPNLAIQFGTDTLAAFLLCLVIAGLRANSVLGRARWMALAGIGAFALKELPYWNWYGFSVSFISMEALDLIGKFFISGLVLGALFNKLNQTVGVKVAHA